VPSRTLPTPLEVNLMYECCEDRELSATHDCCDDQGWVYERTPNGPPPNAEHGWLHAENHQCAHGEWYQVSFQFCAAHSLWHAFVADPISDPTNATWLRRQAASETET
jgi:hypothetical protein